VLAFGACQRTEPPAPTTGSNSTPAPVSRLEPQAAVPPSPAPVQPAPRPVPPLPDPLPGKRQDVSAAVGKAWRVAIGDFDGDGKRELAVADSDKLRVLNAAGNEIASLPVPGGIQLLVAADLDRDGHDELYAGWGQSRDHRDAKAKIARYTLQHGQLVEDTIATPDTPRPEITSLVPVDKDVLLVAYYSSKYNTKSALARHGATGWQLEPLAEMRMGTSYARGDVDGDGKPDVVVGRVYGDAKGVDGDAFVLAPDGKRTAIPTLRGVRSLAIAEGDIYFGDGWHQNYAESARGRVNRAHHAADGFHTELIEDTPGQFAIDRLLPATIDGRRAIVTMGNAYVRVYSRAGEKWEAVTIAGAARDIAVGDLDGKPGDEIVVIGDKSEIVKITTSDFAAVR